MLLPYIGFYVTVIRDKRIGYLLGPYGTHAEALDMVWIARQMADKIDPMTCFDAFGTTKIISPTPLHQGVLMSRLKT